MNISFNQIEQIWHTPAFSSLLESRREGLIIVGAGVLHLGLSLAGLPGWSCPILAATGVPCPGCGLTRASMQFVRGDFSGSFQTHAFAPIFLFALLLIAAVRSTFSSLVAEFPLNISAYRLLSSALLLQPIIFF
jgi:hypothetical protein